jgi:hypothetical protein
VTLYLHVGAHKTGTTTIQQFSAARRRLLLEKGLYYPDFVEIGRPTAASHHAFAHAIAGQPTTPPFSESQIDAFVDLCAKRSRAGTVLVSAEAIFRHEIGSGPFGDTHRAYIERLATRLRPIPDIVTVVCLRRQDTFAASMVQEHIKTTTMTRSLGQFGADFASFMDFEEHVDLYESAFGPGKVLIYERLMAGDGLVRNFFRELGVELSADEAAFRSFNPSLHPAVVLYKARANTGGTTAVPAGRLPQSLLYRVSEDLFGGQKRSLFAPDELDSLFASYAQSNERLARHLGLPPGMPLFPDRGPLPPLYQTLPDDDFHRIDARVAQLVAERQANRVRTRPRTARRPKPWWRRLLTRLAFRGGRHR